MLAALHEGTPVQESRMGTVRRSAVVLAVLIIVLNGCSDYEKDGVSDAMPRVRLTLSDDFSKTGLSEAGEGNRYGIVESGANKSGATIENGLMSHGAPAGRNGASYLEARMPGDVQRLGANAVFFNRNSGSIALVVWHSSLAAARNKPAPGPFPLAGMHFVAYPLGWHLGVFTNKGEDVIKTVNFPSALKPDGKTPYTFDLTRAGDRVWVTGPDGTITGPIRDPRISQWAGPWACWELYEYSPDMAPAAIAKVWAG
jgi:hypothetical protein